MSAPASGVRAARLIPLAWGLAAFVGLAALARGPGMTWDEARALGGLDRDAPGQAGVSPAELRAAATGKLPAALWWSGEAVAARLGQPRLAGARFASVLAAAILAFLVAAAAGRVAGPAAAALAPALLLLPARLLLPLLQAGPRAMGAALAVAALLAYRRATAAPTRRMRLGAAVACGALFGLALAAQLESVQLLAVVALHAALAPVLAALRSARAARAPAESTREVVVGSTSYTFRQLSPPPPSAEPAHPGPGGHPRSSLAALGAMLTIGPAMAVAAWPWLWRDTAGRLRVVAAAFAHQHPFLHLGEPLTSFRPPWGYPAMITALALPAAVAVTFAIGWVHGAWRLARVARTGDRAAGSGPGPSDDLLLLLGATAPFVATQLGLWVRAPGPGPWLPAFPFLAVLGARAVQAAAATVWPYRARWLAAALGVAVVAPAVAATIHAYPILSASWGELAGGTPGAASLGLARHDGEATAPLLAQISTHARPAARVSWGSMPGPEVIQPDGGARPDLEASSHAQDPDVVLVADPAGDRREEYAAWAAVRTTTPVAGVFLDDVPLAWVYARPGAWR